MKKQNLQKLIVAFSAMLWLLVISCNQIGKGHTEKPKKQTDLAFSNEVIKNFATIELSSPVAFKMGLEDNKDASIETSYAIGKYAVTREVWSRVYKWATETTQKEGMKSYKFSEKANIGDVTSNKNEPMGYVTYLDSVVWCNAFTEYLNYVHKDDSKWTPLVPVYYEYKNEARDAFDEFLRAKEKDRARKYDELLKQWILREAVEPINSKTGMEFNEFYHFNGYRLPTTEEWEFASRLATNSLGSYDTSKTVNIQGTSYYLLKGLCLSGSGYAYNDNSDQAKEANKKVATNFDKLLTGPLPDSDDPPSVAKKDANAIGCFDMSGGVWEWTLPKEDRHLVLNATGIGLDSSYPTFSNLTKGINRRKGGSYISRKTEEYAVGFEGAFPMKQDDSHKEKWQRKDIGFRLTKTLKNFF